MALGSPLAQKTVRVLRAKIASGEWPVNSKIPTEAELVAELGVGRSTVREAVRSLANLGMLEPAVSRGTFVRSRSPVSQVLSSFLVDHDLGEVLGFRRALEVEAAELAALRRTDEQLERLVAAHAGDISDPCAPTVERGKTPGQFHALVLEAAQNRLLADLHTGTMAALREGVTSGRISRGQPAEGRHHDHQLLLDAIRTGDAEAAAQAAGAHAERDLVIVTDVPVG